MYNLHYKNIETSSKKLFDKCPNRRTERILADPHHHIFFFPSPIKRTNHSMLTHLESVKDYREMLIRFQTRAKQDEHVRRSVPSGSSPLLVDPFCLMDYYIGINVFVLHAKKKYHDEKNEPIILRSPSSTPVERSDFLQLLEMFVARCFKAVLPSLKDSMLYYALICGTVRMLPKNSQVIYDGFLLLFGQVVQIRMHDLGSTPSFDLGRGSGEVPSYTVSQVARKIL
ncbi:hypothetical protein BDA99DRAFT_568462 [Phascolomyces articulosus]|uniref:Uncharacterized protein n=1 Tax=Phascolomyces articulosus TaxID=60185 RepID=A0AAD5K9V7_9FUNG|nr:hypothetical protein BDA99DRAFT_568462 [Phascolomyces articulosus]